MTRTLTIEYKEEVLADLGLTPEEFADEVKFVAAAKLYELGRLSSGVAAELCGMSRVKFLLSLSRIRVPMIDVSDEELAKEVEFGRG
jgi:predicted HTH domain antitoxin